MTLVTKPGKPVAGSLWKKINRWRYDKSYMYLNVLRITTNNMLRTFTRGSHSQDFIVRHRLVWHCTVHVFWMTLHKNLNRWNQTQTGARHGCLHVDGQICVRRVYHESNLQNETSRNFSCGKRCWGKYENTCVFVMPTWLNMLRLSPFWSGIILKWVRIKDTSVYVDQIVWIVILSQVVFATSSIMVTLEIKPSQGKTPR